MSRNNHPIEHEELMAYLDGELETGRAVEAAAHLERCVECQELAAELKKISQELMGWEIDPDEMAGIPNDIAVELEKPRKQAKKAANWRMWGILVTPRRLAWSGGLVVVLLLAVGVFMVPRHAAIESAAMWPQRDEHRAQLVPPATPAPSTYTYDSLGRLTQDGDSGYVSTNGLLADRFESGQGSTGKLRVREEQDSTENEESESKPNTPAAPMIARTAGLTLVAKEFEKTRAALEEILKRHNGYIGEMNVTAPSDAGRTLTATLRVPAPQLDAALSELKKLGRVENESQGGEEVTAQYVDLEARLKNAQHTEQRLTQILNQRTGKLQDVLKVELEIDRVRGEIEQMQAERKELTKRVAFATLNTTVKEEYHATLQGAPPSTGSRFHNAAVDGYNSVVEGFISVGLFLLSAGPSLLIWAAILFFPVRWAWRKIRAELKKNHEQTAE